MFKTLSLQITSILFLLAASLFFFVSTPIADAETCQESCIKQMTDYSSNCPPSLTYEACGENAIGIYTSCISICVDNTNTTTKPKFSNLIKEGLIQFNMSEECKTVGSCSLQDIMQLIVNIQTFIFGITGSILFVILLLGGFTWMTSAGNPGRVTKGLHTMRDAFIGLIIVLAAYAIVNLVISVMISGQIPGPESTLEDTLDTDLIETINE